MPQHQVLSAPLELGSDPTKPPAGPGPASAAAAAAAGAKPSGASAAAAGTIATPAHALHAFDVLCHHLLGGSRAPLGAPGFEDATWCGLRQLPACSCLPASTAHIELCPPLMLLLLHPPITHKRSPLFVSWHKASSRAGGGERLRGCIGTLEARPLRAGLRDYALTSALRDRRFSPIEARELPALRCTVSLLSAFEPAAAWDDWEVGTHGAGGRAVPDCRCALWLRPGPGCPAALTLHAVHSRIPGARPYH